MVKECIKKDGTEWSKVKDEGTTLKTSIQRKDDFRKKNRRDTRLPKSLAGGQRPYLRSLDHLRSSSGVKKIKS